MLLASAAAASQVCLLFGSRDVAQALSGGHAYAVDSPLQFTLSNNSRHDNDDLHYYTSKKFMSCDIGKGAFPAIRCTGPLAHANADEWSVSRNGFQ